MPVSDWDLSVERSETLIFIKSEFRTRADRDKLLWEEERVQDPHPLRRDWSCKRGAQTNGAGEGVCADGREHSVLSARVPGSRHICPWASTSCGAAVPSPSEAAAPESWPGGGPLPACEQAHSLVS